MASKDTQSRKYQLTINNPADKGLDHDAIKKALEQLTACSYYCMAYEIGTETQTPHTHVFVYLRNSTRFSRIKNLFPEAHIEAAHGTVQENREYVSKSGNGTCGIANITGHSSHLPYRINRQYLVNLWDFCCGNPGSLTAYQRIYAERGGE